MSIQGWRHPTSPAASPPVPQNRDVNSVCNMLFLPIHELRYGRKRRPEVFGGPLADSDNDSDTKEDEDEVASGGTPGWHRS